jgi:Type II secretory pathway, component PulD
MKWKIQLLAVVAALFAGGLRAETPPVVEVEGRIVRCPSTLMTGALGAVGVREEGAVLTGAQAKTVLNTLQQGRAEFLDRPLVVSGSGVAAKSMSVAEFRFPVEFETNPRTGKQTPTVFEARDVGTTVDYTPVVLPSGEVALDILAERVRFREFRKDDAGRIKPVFSTSTAKGLASLPDGGTVVMRFSPDTLEEGPGEADKSGVAMFLFSTARIVPETEEGVEQ